MARSGSEEADAAAWRLAYESQFAELREVLEGLPGITVALPPMPGMSKALDEMGGWVLPFNIEPSEEGIEALDGLTGTLCWCEEHHDELGLPAFEALVVFAAGFLLQVAPVDDFEGDGQAVAPDLLARALHDHYLDCVMAKDEEMRRWGEMLEKCIADYRGSRPGLLDLDESRFSCDLVDGERCLLAVFQDGRPVAEYRFEETSDTLRWRRGPTMSSGEEGFA